ncbi:type III-B CRISPR module-associated protein Cmr5 [Paenibacillus sp. NPDC058071]|uniref:type III-B CRISPR module-associated protein Cmr5 n=1 Tax=Paenibacillus sp. NPDC058071 TaxID=3346326 RepID=UPI0036DD92AA
MKSIDQTFASAAYLHVQQIKEKEQKYPGLQRAYGSLCHRFPSMVLLNGLRLTVVFFEAKGSAGKDTAIAQAYNQFIEDLKEVLVLKSLNFDSAVQYRQQTRKALKAAVWYKRYAEAILGVTEAQELEAAE